MKIRTTRGFTGRVTVRSRKPRGIAEGGKLDYGPSVQLSVTRIGEDPDTKQAVGEIDTDALPAGKVLAAETIWGSKWKAELEANILAMPAFTPVELVK